MIASGAATRDAFLGDALMIRQPARGYRAGVDAILLAASVSAPAPDFGGTRPRQPFRVADLGAGVGTVGLAVARRIAAAEVVLVEREPVLAALARENVSANGLGERARVVEADIASKPADLERLGLAAGAFDAVVANPPYHESGRGTPAAEPIKAAANAMPEGGIEDWARALARACRPGGTVYVIHKASAMLTLANALERRFGALTIVPIRPRTGAPAIRVLVRGTKGSRAPLTVASDFVLHGEGHGFTPAAAAILRRMAPLIF